MRNICIIALVICIASISAIGAGNKSAPEKGSTLTPDIVAEIQESFTLGTYTKATLNALSQNCIRDIAKNQKVWNSLNYDFSLELDVHGMTDQESSGRCWLFATFNVLREKVIEKYNLDDFVFSENYAMFWDKLEKANMFLEYIIQNPKIDTNDQEFILLLKTPLPDGGFWHMSANCIMKYGAVPRNVMPESHNSNNTRRMNGIITQKLRIDAFELRDMAANGKKAKHLRKAKVKMLKDIYRMLVLNLGLPPAEFEWRYTDTENDTTITMKFNSPKEFYDEVVGVNLNDFYVIGNCPTQPYGKNYSIKLGRGQIEGMDWTFLNMEMNVLKDIAYKVLTDSVMLEFSVDMGQFVESKAGYMAVDLFDYESIYDVELPFDKSIWILARESMPNHSMVLVGLDEVDGKPVKWKVENSWGTDRGDSGFFVMTDDWFDKFGYSVVVHKDFLPEDILELAKKKPVELPFWDPLARTISVGGYDQ